MACAICKTRREKRQCPGVQGEICAICCGEQREETVACPFDCEYLRIAHQQETREKKDPAGMPNAGHRISQEFLGKNIELITSLQHALLMSALDNNAIDNDIKEALDGLVRTWQTLESRIYYDSRPANFVAAAIFDAVKERIAEVLQAEDQRGVHKILNSHILSVLIFLQQMEYAFNNGRGRGRSFLDNVRMAMAEFVDLRQPDPGSLLVS